MLIDKTQKNDRMISGTKFIKGNRR